MIRTYVESRRYAGRSQVRFPDSESSKTKLANRPPENFGPERPDFGGVAWFHVATEHPIQGEHFEMSG